MGTTPCEGAGNGDITKDNATRFVDMHFRITGRAAFVPGTGNGELVGCRSEVAYIRDITL